VNVAAPDTLEEVPIKVVDTKTYSSHHILINLIVLLTLRICSRYTPIKSSSILF
jgi:hypothetical protein